MNLVFKKILAALLLPVPISLFCLLFGFFLLLINKKNPFALGILLSGILIYIAFSTPFVPNLLLKGLEAQYHPLKIIPTEVKNILVLGAGNGGYPNYPANDKLNAASLARLIEGIRIYKLIPNSTLILSGGRVFGSLPDSDAMNNVASMLEVNPKHIRIENGSNDTYQEALYVKKILGKQPFILVTSGYHMPRAMKLFKDQGMHPIPAPTELLLGSKRYTIKRYFPNASNLQYSDIAIHEYLGLIWSRLQGNFK